MDKKVIVHPDAFSDLDHSSTVLAASSLCVTSGGKRAVEEILTSPIYCTDTLRARAKDIVAMCSRAKGIREKLMTIKEDEEGAVWCCTESEDMDDDTQELLRDPYFRGMAKPLNNTWLPLWANNSYTMFLSPALALSAPLSYLLAPFFIIRFKLKIPLDFRTFVRLMYHSFKGVGAAMNLAFGNTPTFVMQLASVVATVAMYFQAVVSAFRQSFKITAVCRRVAKRMNECSRVIGDCLGSVEGVDEAFYDRWIIGNERKSNGGPPLGRYSERIRPWCTGYPRGLRDFWRMDKSWGRAMLRRLFHLDAVCALCFAASKYSMTPVRFMSDTRALVIIGECRARKNEVRNDVTVAREANGIVLTGANASGKSTVLRMVGCVVLLAQTIGLSPARTCGVFPVKYITTMMGIKDDPSTGRSRFQNELLRAGECVESARRCPNDFGILLMDEIFGGTDPTQGDVCGGKVLTSLSETKGCMYILATHQAGLVEHSRDIDGCRRFKMGEGYAVSGGVNEVYNATDMFAEKIPS